MRTCSLCGTECDSPTQLTCSCGGDIFPKPECVECQGTGLKGLAYPDHNQVVACPNGCKVKR